MGLNEDIMWFSSDLGTKILKEVPFSVHRLIFIKTKRGSLDNFYHGATSGANQVFQQKKKKRLIYDN